jgi:hypothetical protein
VSASIPAPFNFDDLDSTITDEDKFVMVETILAWADLDTGISRLILLMFGLEDDAGSILIGNMDLKTKVERLKLLNDHHGYTGGAASLGQLITSMRHYSASRNTLAHRKHIGRMKSQPTRLVFLSSRHVKGSPGRFEILCIDHSEFIASAKFARDAAVKIGAMIERIEGRRNDGGDGGA